LQSSRKYERCSEGEVKEYLRYVERRFGIPRELFDKYVFLKKGKNIWIFSGDQGVLNDFKKIETIGIKFLTVTRKFIKPTTAFLQIFGKYARKNIVELKKEEEMVEFMTGGMIKRKFNAEKGFVIVKYHEDILGCGLYTNTGLLSQIPKSRRIDKRWVEEANPEANHGEEESID